MLKLIKGTSKHLKQLNQVGNKYFRASQSLKNKIEIFVDDKPIKVDSTYSIWQACWEAGVIVPRFCFHERLSVEGNCRMCLVEVERSPKPVAACSAQVMPGMKIKTKSETTRIARGGVVEFILANHPLDCPICDQGGECDLQDITQIYGYGEGRYMEYKRAVQDKNYGPLISTIMNRCIHCTRCVRFATQIAGEQTLGKVGRGKAAEIGTYIDKFFNSELSGNIVDICPVGALTSQPYAFTARPWELKDFYSTDVFESIGASIQIDTRGAEIMRVLPRIHEEVNEEWISDKTRHAFDGLKRQRLTQPLQRGTDGTYTQVTWEDSLKLVAKKLASTPGNQIASIIGEFACVESIVALKDLFNSLDSDNFEIRQKGNLALNADFRSNYVMNSQIIGVEQADVLLLIGSDIKQESPVFNSRILRAVKDNNLKVFVIGTPIDTNYDYVHLGTSTKALEEIANGKHPFAERLKKAKLPMVIVGANALQREDGAGIYSAVKKIATSTPILNKANGWNGFNILHKEISRVGALDLGINPSPKEAVKNAKFVLILGADNNISPSDIPSDAFVVYMGTHGDEGAYFADVILPSAAYTEKNSTYVNTEGRVQLTRLAVQPAGGAREDWQIIRALSEEIGSSLPYDTLEELRYRMAELAPHLLKYDYIEPTVFGEVAIKPNKIDKITLIDSPITTYIDNYYMTDAISRSSVTMAKCSTAFNPARFDNFKKN